MRLTRPFKFLPDLQMPLRDALRGVANLSEATEEALEPALRLLPEPLRSGFHDALKSVEGAGKRLLNAPVDLADLTRAQRVLTGGTHDAEAARACAWVICHAWEHLQGTGLGHRHLISETILATQLQTPQSAPGAPAAWNAARVIGQIRASSAIGRIPGFVGTVTEPEKQDTDLALIAIAVWLLSDRAERMDQEEGLLDLSAALIRALHDGAPAPADNPDALARFLENASAHL
ncbi:MAG: hypothetical protein RLP08_18070 [Marinovum algicola]|uniref:hypothetical protein n=1 Tax=Roseobacteraceae TaxID=2854170 RepID=UPI0032ECFCE5